MTQTEVYELLVLASVVDNRIVTEATARVWHQAIGHLERQVAVEAMYDHFRKSTDYLLPGHITAGVRRVYERRDREARRAQGAIERQPITLDRAKFEADTQVAIAASRAAKAQDGIRS